MLETLLHSRARCSHLSLEYNLLHLDLFVQGKNNVWELSLFFCKVYPKRARIAAFLDALCHIWLLDSY